MTMFQWWVIGIFGLLMVGLYARDKAVNKRLKNIESVIKHYVLNEKSNIVKGKGVKHN